MTPRPTLAKSSPADVGQEDGRLGASADRAATASQRSPQAVSGIAGITDARIERLALNLRAYAYAMGAPRTDVDEEVALGAAREILPIVDAQQ